MSGYGDVKSRKVRNLLNGLERQGKIESREGDHTTITCIRNGQSYPVPTKHNTVNKHIVKKLMKWLVKNKVCTREEFDKQIK